MFMYCYHQASRGGKALAKELGIKRIRHENSEFDGSNGDIVLNWGATKLPDWHNHLTVINRPAAIREVSNKLRFFRNNEGSGLTPIYTEDIETAKQWIDEGITVVCRTVLTGHSGKGIVIAETKDQLVNAKLYVTYVPKQYEFRVHVFRGEVINVQQKKRRNAVPDDEVNWQIRNHKNGFIYARKDLDVPKNVYGVATEVMDRTDLDFGAVDILVTKKGKVLALEINTAPGLQGSSIELYADAIKQHYFKKED